MLKDLKNAVTLTNRASDYMEFLQSNINNNKLSSRLMALHYFNHNSVKDTMGFVSLTQVLYIASQIDSLFGTEMTFRMKNTLHSEYGRKWATEKGVRRKVSKAATLCSFASGQSRFTECLAAIRNAAMFRVMHKSHAALIRKYYHDIFGKNKGNAFLSDREYTSRTFPTLYKTWEEALYYTIQCEITPLSELRKVIMILSAILGFPDLFIVEETEYTRVRFGNTDGFVVATSDIDKNIMILITEPNFKLLMYMLMTTPLTDDARTRAVDECFSELFASFIVTQHQLPEECYKHVGRLGYIFPAKTEGFTYKVESDVITK